MTPPTPGGAGTAARTVTGVTDRQAMAYIGGQAAESRVNVEIEADAPEDRLQRLMQRAEKYCVVSATLKNPPEVEMHTSIVATA